MTIIQHNIIKATRFSKAYDRVELARLVMKRRGIPEGYKSRERTWAIVKIKSRIERNRVLVVRRVAMSTDFLRSRARPPSVRHRPCASEFHAIGTADNTNYPIILRSTYHHVTPPASSSFCRERYENGGNTPTHDTDSCIASTFQWLKRPQ